MGKARADRRALMNRAVIMERAQRHQERMIRKASLRNRAVPLIYFDVTYWWLRRCGWAAKEFSEAWDEIWRWWKSLDILVQYRMMAFNRRFGVEG